MNTPEQLKYNLLDEWVKAEGITATIGITDYAQDQLSDVVYAEIKVSPGAVIQEGDLIAVIESVKASSDIFSPLSGKVLVINDELIGTPEMINQDPYGQAWIIKMELSNPTELAQLLDAEVYAQNRM